MKFNEMNLDSFILQGLSDMGIVNPTEIQDQSIPIMMNSKDAHIMGQAKTGTGKTLAFAIPILQMINLKEKTVQAVVLVPTRELCKQVSEVFTNLAKYRNIKAVEIYGGVSINKQIQEIRNGGQIVIATPGRLIDIFRQGKIKFNSVKFVALDEADRMLDMGFMPDIEFLMLKAMKGVHPRLMLYSATLADQIKSLAQQFTHGKELIEINVSKDDLTVADCEQIYYIIKDFGTKYAHFIEIINENKPRDMIIFVRTKHWADKLLKIIRSEKQLNKELFLKAGVLHGDLTQAKRETIMRQFKDQEINCLISTNLAARGLDFTQVSHIFNYDFPDQGDAVDEYIHRIGRCARIDSKNNGITTKGVAVSLVSRSQMGVLKDIENHINRKLVNKPLPEIKDISNYNVPQSKQDGNGKANAQGFERRHRDSPRRSGSSEGAGRSRNSGRSTGSGRAERTGRPRNSERSERPKRFDNSNQSPTAFRPKKSEKMTGTPDKRKKNKPAEEKFTTKIIPINQKS
jgi:superfamily II DNA/RNA helicase